MTSRIGCRHGSSLVRWLWILPACLGGLLGCGSPADAPPSVSGGVPIPGPISGGMSRPAETPQLPAVPWSVALDPGPGGAPSASASPWQVSTAVRPECLGLGTGPVVAVLLQGKAVAECYDARSGRKLGQITGLPATIDESEVAPDGGYLACTFVDVQDAMQTKLRAGAFGTGQMPFEASFPPQQLLALRFCADGRLLTVAKHEQGAEITTWDVASGAKVGSFVAQTGRAASHAVVAVTPGGRYCGLVVNDDLLALGPSGTSPGRTVHLYELAGGVCVGRVSIPRAERPAPAPVVYGLACSDDGRQLAAIVHLPHQQVTRLCAWELSQGSLLFDAQQPAVKQHLLDRPPGRVPKLRWLAGGQWLVCGRILVDARNGQAVESVAAAALPSRDEGPRREASMLDGQHVLEFRLNSEGTWEIAVVEPEPVAAATVARDGMDSATPSTTTVPWSATAAPPTAAREIADDLQLVLPPAVERVWCSHRPSSLASVSHGDRYVVHDLRTGQQTGEVKLDGYCSELPLDVTTDGKYLVRHGPQLDVWDLSSTAHFSVQTLHSWPPVAEFISDGELLVVERANEEWSQTLACRVAVWRFPEHRKTGEFTFGEQAGVWRGSLAVSPGGRYLAAAVQASDRRTTRLQVHEVRTGQVVGQAPLSGPDNRSDLDRCWGAAFSSDGGELGLVVQLRSSPAARLLVWNFATGQLALDSDLGGQVQLVPSTTHRDGRHEQRLACLADGTAWVLDGRLLVERRTGQATPLSLPAGFADYQRIDRERALGLAREPKLGGVLTLVRGDGDPAGQLQRALAAIPRPQPPVAPVASAPLPQLPPAMPAAPATPAAAPRVVRNLNPHSPWQLEPDPPRLNADLSASKNLAVTLPASATIISPLRPSPYVALWGRDNSPVRLVDLRTGKDVAQLQAEVTRNDDACLSPDGRYLVQRASGGGDRIVRVWSFQTGKLVAELGEANGIEEVDYLNFAGPHQLVVAWDSSGCHMLVWDLEQGKALHRLTLPEAKLIDISPGGRYAALLFRGLLHVVDLTSGQLVASSSVPMPRNSQLLVSDLGLRFSPDGAELAALSQFSEQHLVCWDVASGRMTLHRPYNVNVYGDTAADPPYLEWLHGNNGWLYGGETLIDRQTGAAVWRLEDEILPWNRFVGQDAVLDIVRKFGRSDELRPVPVPAQDWAVAFKAARAAASEQQPPLRQVDLSEMADLPTMGNDHPWEYQPAPVSADRRARRLSFESEETYQYVDRKGLHAAGPDTGRAAVQKTVEAEMFTTDPHFGPRRPGRRNWLALVDGFEDRTLAEIEIRGWDEIQDVSPDGSLVLTASAFRHGYPPYDRLDVWAPDLKGHAVGWRPHVDDPTVEANLVRWARFVDKRHVLTWSETSVVLWELPACKAVYERRYLEHLIAFSLSRQHILTCRKGSIFQMYETMTGRCVGSLEAPAYRDILPQPRGCFRPDGKAALAIFPQPFHQRVVVWDLTTGKITRQFGIPEQVSVDEIEWMSERYVAVGNLIRLVLLDLENRAVVGDRELDRVYDFVRLGGGVLWTRPPQARGWKSAKLTGQPLLPPAEPSVRLEDQALLYPGLHVGVNVTSELLDRQLIQEELERSLAQRGLVPDATAPRRFTLNIVEQPGSAQRQLRDGRELTSRTLIFDWKLVDGAGTVLWQQQRPIPWQAVMVTGPQANTQDLTQQMLRDKIHESLGNVSVPEYLFPKLDQLKVPRIKFPNEP